jgi:hypothetical protein
MAEVVLTALLLILGTVLFVWAVVMTLALGVLCRERKAMADFVQVVLKSLTHANSNFKQIDSRLGTLEGDHKELKGQAILRGELN